MFACARRRLVVGIVALAASTVAGASPVYAEGPAMNVGGKTNPPVGYIDFCRNFPAECMSVGAASAEELTERRWRDLQEVNTFVNRIILPATDRDFYQRDEVWTLPETRGDCEDYVLLKRKWLVERGWPTGTLLVSVVFDELGDGHAVLVARTGRGDFVLDNKSDEIRAWYQTTYRFVKRQSVEDPNRWVSVGDTRWTAQSTAASR